MNSQEVKKILALYRPGTADDQDPLVMEALAAAWRDPQLRQWLRKHTDDFTSVRQKFDGIPVPDGLKQQIIAEQRIHILPAVEKRNPWVLVCAGAALMAAVLAVMFWLHPRQRIDFATYRGRMVTKAQEIYGMELETNNLNAIRSFLAAKNAPAEYVLPRGIKNARPVGCATVRWQGRPVSMICFKSRRPLEPGDKSNLWLFIVDNNAVPDAPAGIPPVVTEVNQIVTASWTLGNKTYILALSGDETLLRQYM